MGGRPGSNRRPQAPQARALTKLSYIHRKCNFRWMRRRLRILHPSTLLISKTTTNIILNFSFFCALGGTRTHNLIVRTDVLYPLSYEGKLKIQSLPAEFIHEGKLKIQSLPAEFIHEGKKINR